MSEAVCPKNGCDLRAGEIPEDSRQWYGGKTHYSLMLAHEIPEVYDGVLFWSCPKCGEAWPAFSSSRHWNQKALDAIEKWKAVRDE